MTFSVAYRISVVEYTLRSFPESSANPSIVSFLILYMDKLVKGEVVAYSIVPSAALYSLIMPSSVFTAILSVPIKTASSTWPGRVIFRRISNGGSTLLTSIISELAIRRRTSQTSNFDLGSYWYWKTGRINDFVSGLNAAKAL